MSATRCSCIRADAITALVIEAADPFCPASDVHARTDGQTGADTRQTGSGAPGGLYGAENGENG